MTIPTQDLYFLGLKALIQNDKGEYLMLQVNKNKLKKYSGDAYRDMPGGRVDRGENIDKVLTREILEETGFQQIDILQELGTAVLPIRIPVGEDDFGLILTIYLVKHKGSSEVTISNEHIAYEWCDLKTTIQRLHAKYDPKFLKKIRNQIT